LSSNGLSIFNPSTAATIDWPAVLRRIVHIPEAGYNIRRDRFDRYMAVVRAFLAEWAAAAS
jgi:hypothetical protein